MTILETITLLATGIFLVGCTINTDIPASADQKAFDQASAGSWRETFFDPCTNDWARQWFLDGEVGTVINGPDGMTLTAGPERGNDADHMVLWTKKVFNGDLKIEFDYTHLDNTTVLANILYIEATGMGQAPYVEDIAKWSELRKIPSMALYHDFMNTYHISFASYGSQNKPLEKDYIRARRYMPQGDKVGEGLGKGLENTGLKPDYFNTGLFATGMSHHITVIKKDRELFMKIENAEQTYYCHWINSDLPPITEGRIGLRLMFTRSSLFKNFQVSAPPIKSCFSE